MSVTRIRCSKCGHPIAWCACKKPDATSGEGVSESQPRSGALRTGEGLGQARRYWKPPFQYEAVGSRIIDANGDMILDVRGWGHLTSINGHDLLESVAEQIQDEVGEHVAQILTESWPNIAGQPRRSEA